MIAISLDDHELRELVRSTPALGARIVLAARDRLHDHWSKRVAADADKMVPEQFSILAHSQQVDLFPGGFRITYGGLASEYAAKQHDDPTLHHTPPTNKFSYEGPFGGDKPGAWNPARAGSKTGKRWRFQHVSYARRSLRTSHPIKATATHHWLFGAPHSALDANEAAIERDLADVALRYAKRYLQGAH